MKDKNALVVRRETFNRGKTPSLWLVGMTFLERMDQRADLFLEENIEWKGTKRTI